MPLQIVEADPQGREALALLRLAAAEVQSLYAPQSPDAPMAAPGNPPTSPRGVYLLARLDGEPVGMGAHQPLDDSRSEVRRIFTLVSARRAGVARAILAALEDHARRQGFTALWLETGCRQLPAIALYSALGYARIPPFGPHVDDPTSVCFAKRLVEAAPI